MLEHSLDFSAALIMGLLGSAHCIGMCGGIGSALTLNIPFGKNHTRTKSGYILAYNLGRIGSYSVAGFIVGLVGLALTEQIQQLSYVLRTLSGLLIIAIGLYIGSWWQGVSRIELIGKPLWRALSPLTQRFLPPRSMYHGFALGALWGWLPCGLVYTALALSATTATPASAALTMLGFGLGTLPALLITSLFAQTIMNWVNHHTVRTVMAIALIVFGLWALPFTQKILIYSLQYF